MPSLRLVQRHQQQARDVLSIQEGRAVSDDKVRIVEATDEGLIQMWIETEARDGRMCKITYKGQHHFVERTDIVEILGYDPDDPWVSRTSG